METSSDGDQAQGSAKDRTGRRKAIAAIALVALLAGGISLLQALDGGKGDNEAPVSGTALPSTGPSLPSTGPVLEWVEFDPGLNDSGYFELFEPLSDGRILLRVSRDDIDSTRLLHRFMVTDNGLDWTELPMPESPVPLSYHLTGDRWLVAGVDFLGKPELPDPRLPGGPEPTAGETEDRYSLFLSGYRALFSDDQGASWTELEFDFSTSSIPAQPVSPDYLPFYTPVAFASGNRMVVVLQGQEEGAAAANDTSDDEPTEIIKARIFASDGGALEQVAEYDGWVLQGPYGGSFATPNGFSLQLYLTEPPDQLPPRQLTLTSPDGRAWSESESATGIFPTAPGSDQSVWKAVWLGNGFGLQQLDRNGNLSAEVALENSLPFGLSGGSSGLAVNVMTVPGTDLFAIADQRIAKGNYELRLNEPEGGFSLWDLSADTAIYKCESVLLWETGHAFPGEECHFTHPEDADDDPDSVVLVFEDRQTGAELASFTREELAPVFPLWTISGLAVDSPEGEENWLGWSANGVAWGWQTPADAFGIDDFDPDDALIQLAVGDGFVLARVQPLSSQGSFHPSRWYIAQVP